MGPDTRDVERVLDGDGPWRLDDDLLAIAVPGHSRGSCALLYRETFLFTGDHLWAADDGAGLAAGRRRLLVVVGGAAPHGGRARGAPLRVGAAGPRAALPPRSRGDARGGRGARRRDVSGKRRPRAGVAPAMGRRFESATVNVGSGARSLDRVRVIEWDGGLAVALADGAGGMAAGDRAADAAMEALDGADVAAWLATDGLAAAARLDALDRGLAVSPHGGQCTAVLVAVTEGRVVGASVGDSGVWCGGRATRLDLTRAQRRKPLVGDGGARATAFAAGLAGGRVLVASDGLFHYAPIEKIWQAAMTGTVREAAARLVSLVRLPGGSLCDDVSIALVDRAG